MLPEQNIGYSGTDRRFRENPYTGPERRRAELPQHPLIETVRSQVQDLLQQESPDIIVEHSYDPASGENVAVVVDLINGIHIAEQRTGIGERQLGEDKSSSTLYKQDSESGQEYSIKDIELVDGDHLIQVSNGTLNYTFDPSLENFPISDRENELITDTLRKFNLRKSHESTTIYDASKNNK